MSLPNLPGTPTAPARNAGIDCLRGLAILLVIVHHLALPFRLPLGPSLLGGWWPKRLVDAISFSGYEAVFIFFVISGFLIASGIIERDGSLQRVALGRFYARRSRRILPLLLLVLASLAVLAWLGIPGFAPESGAQGLPGLLGSALSFTFNWYEGRTGWAPPAWDVLWSLSIEEAFYLGFPLLCLSLPPRLLVATLALWALCLSPLRELVPASDEVWREKAYLPGMSAIAWGVLAALLARRWTPSRREARLMAAGGVLCLLLVLGWGDLVYRHLFKTNLYGLCIGSCLLLLAFHAFPPRPWRGLRPLARIGALSYELYLSHMFVVLGMAAAYRALLGDDQAWTFLVYLPALLACRSLAGLLERLPARLGMRSAVAARAAS